MNLFSTFRIDSHRHSLKVGVCINDIAFLRRSSSSSSSSISNSSSKYYPSTGVHARPSRNKYDAVVIGAGHNGLITAAYLSRAGYKVLVLERRHLVGGAGYKFSRASYLAGLLRPQIISDLELESYGFKYLPRNPSSFTPTKQDSIYKGKYLLLGDDPVDNWNSIAQFSHSDADRYPKYEEFLGKVREIMQPVLDNPLPEWQSLQGGWKERLQSWSTAYQLMRVAYRNRSVLIPFYELFTGPAQQILDRWFESDILKTTLATDAVIGALNGPHQNGSAYVLLHHVMGEAAGKKGVWAYVEGGMGALSEAIAASARNHGAEIITNCTVKRILHISSNNKDGEKNHEPTVLLSNDKVRGIELVDGSVIETSTVISAATAYHTFTELIRADELRIPTHASTDPLEKFIHHVNHTDYSCGAFKINCAVNRLPNFTCYPGIPLHEDTDAVAVGPMHRGTIHFEYHMADLVEAYNECAIHGKPATRPVIEMTIPSAIDSTLVSASLPGHHVVQLFIQFAPYKVNPTIGSWEDPIFKETFAKRCFAIIDEFCPGFSDSIVGTDILSPLDLERIFGLYQGSISHGSFGIHQLGYNRPVAGYSNHRSPIQGLYLASASTHPGGGVMGACGKNCAQVVLNDMMSSSSSSSSSHSK